MNKKRIFLSLILSILITFTFCIFTFAEKSSFSDISSNYWAREAIEELSQRKIITGYSDNTFRPENTVTRAEFAKLMVITLDIPIVTPEKPTFKDISKDNWVYQYAESAKYYLTGYRNSSGDFFRPSGEAQREDMAVALVKALKLENDSVDDSVLNKFVDKDSISTNLRKYVAIAVKNGIMKGAPVSGTDKFAFNPKKSLTRAETASLLYNLVVQDEKITYEDNNEKITYDPQPSKQPEKDYNTSEDNYLEYEEEDIFIPEYKAPNVKAKVIENKIVMFWQKIEDERLQGYKVVISKSDSTPKYPDNGYLYWITDRNKTEVIINNSAAYNGGDFGKYLVPGQKYYFSVTAVYGDKKVAGNTVALVYPGKIAEKPASNEYIAPKISGKINNGKIILIWQKIADERLEGYKVVISKNNPSPKYPDDGYLYWITDRNRTEAVINNTTAYNGGDFGKYLVPGEKYYFSITAVYKDKKVAGQAISLTYPENSEE